MKKIFFGLALIPIVLIPMIMYDLDTSGEYCVVSLVDTIECYNYRNQAIHMLYEHCNKGAYCWIMHEGEPLTSGTKKCEIITEFRDICRTDDIYQINRTEIKK